MQERGGGTARGRDRLTRLSAASSGGLSDNRVFVFTGRLGGVRAVVVLVLIAPALAGCVGQGDVVLSAQFDGAVPHCVAACGRIVVGTPTHEWEPALAVNPLNPDHIVIVATTEPPNGFYGTYFVSGRTRVAVTEDGGATWEVAVVPSGLDVGPTHPLAAYPSAGYDPVLAFLPDGTLVMSAIATNNLAVPGIPLLAEPGLTLYTTRSTDGGRTWQDVRIVDRGDGVLVRDTFGVAAVGAMWKFNDKEWMTLGPDGTLLLVWTQFLTAHPETAFLPETGARPGGRLVFSSSEDGGLSWSEPRIIDEEGSPHGASPLVGRDGVWRVSYVDYEQDALRFAESRDRGQTWDIRTVGEATRFPRMRAQILASGLERLLLVYAPREEDDPSELRVELTWSDDGGATWSPPIVLDTPQGEGDPTPEVAAGPRDSAWVTFFDLEGERGGQHSRYVAVMVVDGVAGAPLVLDEIDVYPGVTLGHYMGLASTPDGDALAAWVTHRGGQYDLAFARITAGADYAPGPTDWALAQPKVPTGLDEPVEHRFTGRVEAPYYCHTPGELPTDGAADAATSAKFPFEVPVGARYMNGTLSWDTTAPGLDGVFLDLFDPKGEFRGGTRLPPTAFELELALGDEGEWLAWVYNCENPPTDFTLNLMLS